MRTSDFRERIATLFDETRGGKKIFVAGRAGHSVMRQVVLIGNIFAPGDRPFLYAVQADVTDITAHDERLHVSLFRTEPGTRDVTWTAVGSMRRAILNNQTDGVRLIVPTGGNAARIIVDGMPLGAVSDMTPGIQVPQALPPNLEDMTQLLLADLQQREAHAHAA